RVAVGEDASALVTTPGATKFYRSSGAKATQRQRLTVVGGTLEWLPQENIFFSGADVELLTSVYLEGAATFIGWEINCLGRPVNCESFDQGRALFKFSLFRDGHPVLLERLQLADAKGLYSAAGLRGHPIVATLVATTMNRDLPELLRAAIPEAQRHELGITLVDGLLIARYLGDSTATAKRLFTMIWKLLRPMVLQRSPCEPRIWHT
ncbi:MAG: urease accessory protein UreD, partial [Gammaproteobacteria bacterium]|nr:urease accessory protein UreD [Gammaproteobacteria bacterium]